MTAPQRATRQRAAVAEALARAERFKSAQELHDDLRGEGASVGLTTVYRHLQALAEAGQVDVLRTGDGEARYRACPTEEHHHHLVCRRCGRAVEVAGPAVERWAAAVADEHGFTDVTHAVEVFGVCGQCAGAAVTLP
ncbi:MAG: transcriptional repressor [Actinomycetota bacterium]|nr:transcriptional repressor [Actinomycetota bacterium]